MSLPGRGAAAQGEEEFYCADYFAYFSVGVVKLSWAESVDWSRRLARSQSKLKS